jgi:hypothetical protein
MNDPAYADVIDTHYSRLWSPPVSAEHLDAGPVHELPDEFRVLRIKRSAEMMAYATRCMSQPTDKERLELHVFCRPSDEGRAALVEILTAVAHFHRTGSKLGLGHTVNFGKPWVAGSSATHGLISLPYLDGPELEWLRGPEVRFLWLIPVTAAEVQFKKAHGMEALEAVLEEKRFNYLDPFRASVA